VYNALGCFKKGKDRVRLRVFTTADINEDKKKKLFLQIWHGDEMVTLFEHEGKVLPDDRFVQAVTKIK